MVRTAASMEAAPPMQAIFIKAHIPHPMHAVLNHPVASQQR